MAGISCIPEPRHGRADKECLRCYSLSADLLKAFLSEGSEEPPRGLIPQLLTPDGCDSSLLVRLDHWLGVLWVLLLLLLGRAGLVFELPRAELQVRLLQEEISQPGKIQLMPGNKALPGGDREGAAAAGHE